MNENHITIVMVSHDPLIASYSSRLLYLKDGKIEKELFKGDKTQQEYFKEIYPSDVEQYHNKILL